MGIINSYNICIQLDNKFHLAWYVLHTLKRFDEAFEAYILFINDYYSFDNCLKLDNKFHLAWNGKGNVLFSLGKYTESLEA